MMNTLIVVLEALLINVWADSSRGSWPEGVGARILPLGCLAVVAALLFWRGESRACRVVSRFAAITVFACLINRLPFLWNGLDRYGEAERTEIEPSAVVTKASTLLGSVLALEPLNSIAEQEEAQTQSRYLTALSRCIEQKKKQHGSSYGTAKSECTADATKSGQRAFILRNWVK